MQARLYHLHALSALHCGTGQAAGIVDLPIARARATNLPIVPGSSLRGVLREELGARLAKAAPGAESALFGPRNISGDDQAHAGALALGDAHLLALPVRAMAGIVAYATCPFILKRYARDLPPANGSAKPLAVPEPDSQHALHANGNQNLIGGKHDDRHGGKHGCKIVLEDLDLEARHENLVDDWAARIAGAVFPGAAGEAGDAGNAARQDFIQRFLVLPDTVFAFLSETATEIRTRIAIDQATGTVKDGHLWTEENLPAESILWGVYALSDSRVPTRANNRAGAGTAASPVTHAAHAAHATHAAAATATELAAHIPPTLLLQLGGKAGVGRGLTQFLSGSAP